MEITQLSLEIDHEETQVPPWPRFRCSPVRARHRRAPSLEPPGSNPAPLLPDDGHRPWTRVGDARRRGLIEWLHGGKLLRRLRLWAFGDTQRLLPRQRLAALPA